MGFLQYLLGRLPAPDVTAILAVGVALFALSWVVPRRLVTLPAAGPRRRLLIAVGAGGAAFVLVAATAADVAAAGLGAVDPTGCAGWWMRPLALIAVTVVLGVAAVAVVAEPRPDPGTHALAPRRSAIEPVPSALRSAVLAASVILAVTLLWQFSIATTAPENANFYGRTPVHVDLPVWMSFNNGNGYVSGVGWPNHLATAVALVCVLAALWLLLALDARRPTSAAEPMSSSRTTRVATAQIVTTLALAGSLATLGAVWMFVGFTGQIVVGLGNDPQPDVFFGTGYAALARPIQIAGMAAQAAAVAILLRLAVDTARAARATAVKRTAMTGAAA